MIIGMQVNVLHSFEVSILFRGLHVVVFKLGYILSRNNVPYCCT